MKKGFILVAFLVILFVCAGCGKVLGFKGEEIVYDHEADIPYMLEGEVLSISNGSITVKTDLYDGLGIVVSTRFIEGYGYKSDISNIVVGDTVRILYDGKVAESYPPQILSVYSINIAEVLEP